MPSKLTRPAGARRLGQKPHHGQRRHRFARAGFADQPHHLAGRDGELDIPQDRRVADRQRQVLDFEQAHRCRRSFGSSDVGDAVAEQVEAKHGDDDGHAGKDRQPRRHHHARLRVEQHPPPARHWRLRAEPDIGKPGFGQDAERELDGALHQEQSGDVGQDVLDGDQRLALAGGARGEDEFARPDRQRAGAGDAGEDRDVEDADGDDGVDRARAEDRGDHDRREQGREGEDEIVEAHHRFVDEAAARRGQAAERHADAHADADRDQRHRDRVARADHDHRQHVAAEMVGAEPVRRPRAAACWSATISLVTS